ncbi:peptidylprolyl isomerase [Patescibacteria group bacterium]|nr:peptidylprolyl isomerase [Patescibacteria group bacterium]
MEEEQKSPVNLDEDENLGGGIEREGGEKKEEVTPPKKCSGVSPLVLFLLGVVGLLILVVILIAGYGVMSVKKVSVSPSTLKIASLLNLPAVKIDGMSVSYTDYIEDLKTLKKFYESQPEIPQPGDEDLSDQVISRLIANVLIADIAKDYDVEVTQADLDATKVNLLAQFGSEEEAETELQDRYGWSLEKYMQKVVKPFLLEQKLQQKFSETRVDEADDTTIEQIKASHILFQLDPNTNKEDTKTAANEVLKQIKEGADFAEMAAKYGSDGTKDVGGDLGWFGRGVMVPEFEEAVFALESGELSNELVETSFGFHILKVEDKRIVRNFVSFMDEKIEKAIFKFLIDIHNPFESLDNTENTEGLEDTEVIDDTGDAEVIDDVGGVNDAELAE